MDILQQAFINYVNEFTDVDVTRCGFSAGVEQLLTISEEFILEYLRIRLEELDEALMENPHLREGWTVRRKDPRVLETICGTMSFERRYYYNSTTGQYSHLLDILCGIEKSARIDRGLKAAVANLVSSHSYQTTAELAAQKRVSKQAVMQIAREVSVPPLPVEEIRETEVLHIQADEDHVATQDERKSQEVRLAVIHEPSQKHGKKTSLPQKHHVLAHSFNEPAEVFWNRVYEEIVAHYGENWPKIYLHGDAASWIKNGLSWLPGSRFVLDRFHVSQYLSRLAPRGSEAYRQMMQSLWSRKKKDFENLARESIAHYSTNPEYSQQALTYILNNWKGITIWTREPSCGQSCAEGLVSHCLSDRFSSRPMAWQDRGIASIASLREHALNGGKIEWNDFPEKKEEKVIAVAESVNIDGVRAKAKRWEENDFLPEPTMKLARAKRDAAYTIFKRICEGGMEHFA